MIGEAKGTQIGIYVCLAVLSLDTFQFPGRGGPGVSLTACGAGPDECAMQSVYRLELLKGSEISVEIGSMKLDSKKRRSKGEHLIVIIPFFSSIF